MQLDDQMTQDLEQWEHHPQGGSTGRAESLSSLTYFLSDRFLF